MRYTLLFILMLVTLFTKAQRHNIQYDNETESKSDTLTSDQVRVLSQILDNMVFVDGGTYRMGEGEDEMGVSFNDNAPSHIVSLDPFFIGKYEVTQEEWEVVMGNNPSYFKGNRLPVENVSLDDCKLFVNRLNQLTGKTFRLPMEAEWEYAARGGKYSMSYIYAGSDFPGSVAWFITNSNHVSHEVGAKRPNELGLYDMCGNVSEWCSDFYSHDYYKQSPTFNPKGPTSGINHVNRGGGWQMPDTYLRISTRNLSSDDERNSALGFRLAM